MYCAINTFFKPNQTELKYDPLKVGQRRMGSRVQDFEKIASKMKSAPTNYNKCTFLAKSDKGKI